VWETFWTLGGIYLAATRLFSSNATYFNEVGPQVSLPDTMSTQFVDYGTEDIANASDLSLSVPQPCVTNWTDPTSYILSALNNMAFRLSVYAADYPYRNTSIPPAPQVGTMEQAILVNVYRSNYTFLLASTVFSVVCVVLIIPIFVGWWTLGRSLSLNPIEVAKAFDAPLLHGPGSNATAEELVRAMGRRPVRLGEVEGNYLAQVVVRRLKLANPVEVSAPKTGVLYR
jgi:hypothetical protein